MTLDLSARWNWLELVRCVGTRKQGGRGGWELREATSSKAGKTLDDRRGRSNGRDLGHHTTRIKRCGDFIYWLVVK